MGKIRLSEGFRNFQVGKNQKIKLKEVEHDTTFEKVHISFESEDGAVMKRSFMLTNEGALNFLSTLVQAALNMPDTKDVEIDTDALKGTYIIGDVVEREYKNNDGELKTTLDIKNYRPCVDAIEEDDDDSSDPFNV